MNTSHKFSEDWTSQHFDNWSIWLDRFKDRPGIRALEIGSFEGRSALWFLTSILTHPSSRLTCIDCEFERSFTRNTRSVGHKIQAIEGRSELVLRESAFRPNSFHFVYIDGGHRAANVLEDAVLAFRLLAPQGVMIFDDYLWASPTPEDPLSMPRAGIDAFLTVYRNQIQVLYQGGQVAVEKAASGENFYLDQSIAPIAWLKRNPRVSRILRTLKSRLHRSS